MIGRVLGLAPSVKAAAEVFVANRTEGARQAHAAKMASLDEHAAEFERPGAGWFDRLVDGLNRLPRPALALGTLGLFGFAMADPVAFGIRMQGLALIPEPLWWLLGAIVSFYFGARELHHFRGTAAVRPGLVRQAVANIDTLRAAAAPDAAPGQGDNPALEEWRAARG